MKVYGGSGGLRVVSAGGNEGSGVNILDERRCARIVSGMNREKLLMGYKGCGV